YVNDIRSFSDNSTKILASGGKIFFVMLNKVCLWEVIYNLLKFKPVTALKRFTSREKDYKTKMNLYLPRKVKKIFDKNFETDKVKRVYAKARFRLKAGKYMRVAYLQPRSVVLVTARHNRKDNVLPLDWHMPLSLIPKMYCISLESGNYSSQMISSSKVFAVNFM